MSDTADRVKKIVIEHLGVDEGKVTDILVKEGSEGVAVNTTIAILNGSGNEQIFNEENNQDNNNKEVQENKDQIKQTDQKKEEIIIGESQNLRDKEILEFIGED